MNTPMGAPAQVARELADRKIHQAMDILGQWDSNPARKDKKMRSGESVSGPPPAAERQCRLCDFIL